MGADKIFDDEKKQYGSDIPSLLKSVWQPDNIIVHHTLGRALESPLYEKIKWLTW